jgi:ureidoacrylate peracid hydrolase
MEDSALPNLRRLQMACRKGGIEVLYTVIESLTRDGRDRGLDYKISDLHVPKGSRDAEVLDAIAPATDEIVIAKTSSSPFISTNLDYVLRNLGVRSLILAGILTDQCIDSSARDACDLGYLVTIATDACATHSRERHEGALRNNRGYARQRTTAELVAEIERLTG